MLTVLRRLAPLAAAIVLAVPGGAFAQGAGDEQYEDPFAPETGVEEPAGDGDEPVSSEPGGDADSGSDVGSDESAGAGAGTTGGGETGAGAGSGTGGSGATGGSGELPRTGANVGLIAAAGIVLLAGGVALRFRLRDRR